MPEFTILSPVSPPEKCFLSEVLLWRGFGRFPEFVWDEDGKADSRFETDLFYSYKAPIFSGEELQEEECLYAGIPEDPRLKKNLEGQAGSEPSFYLRLLKNARQAENQDAEFISELEQMLKQSIKQQREFDSWREDYSDYVDEFQNEISLDLKRGALTAIGTLLPEFGDSKSSYNSQNWQEYLDDIEWLSDLEVTEIPKDRWVSKDIHWLDSTLFGREKKFIWIFVDVDQMIERYPPKLLIKPNQLFPIGGNYAVTSQTITRRSFSRSVSGRPPLPWTQFHVQVAKMYRDGEMPSKKEAAIAELQDWFTRTTGKSASRSVIGQNLKPYFDALK